MNLLDEPGGARRLVQLAHQRVIGNQSVGDGAPAPHLDQPAEEVARAGQPRVHRALERGRIGVAGPERLVVDLGWVGGRGESGGERDVAKCHGGSG
jgi:hypothetical protein